MNGKDISEAKDPDLRSSLTALRRASKLARKEAIQTGTGIVVIRDGQLVLVDAKTLQKEAENENTPTS